MSVITKIISIVLKSVADNKISNKLTKELIGVSIDETSEIGINKIKDFIIEENTKIDNILSRDNMIAINITENHIDYVVAEIKDLFSRIDIEDEVLRQCKYDSTKLKDYFWDEYSVSKSDYIECESDIKKGMYAVSEAILKLVRESEEFENDFLIQISNSVDDIRLEEQNNFENIMKRFDKVDESNNALFNKVSDNSNVNKKIKLQERVKSRTQEYADKWNQNMFLNDFDKRDENAGINVKLSEVYLEEHLPHYIWGSGENARDDLKDLLNEYIYPHNDNKMLVILGQPGIGKSTLITWITVNFVDKINDILVYRVASDLGKIDWKESRVSSRILEKLDLQYSDLIGKTLILDGFDEVNIESNRRREILDNLYSDRILNKNKVKFSLIITCRENYIPTLENLKCKYIILKPWNERQINSFCNIFQEKTKKCVSEVTKEKLCKNNEILGIPLILYMVLALNISIEKEGSIVDVYDKIFSLEGGIYDRCINNKSFSYEHRIGEIKKQIHQISRDIAIWMFENNADEASIPQENYQKISRNVIQDQKKNEEIEQDFLIGNFFKLVKHCKGIGTEELYFVHRTIYEYFVIETIYSSIESSIMELSDESQEKLAGDIAPYLKQGKIDYTLGEYLRYKILKLYNKLSIEKQALFYQWWEKTVEKMMKMGMFYFTKKTANYINIFAKETQCFNNIIEILRLIFNANRKCYMLENADQVLLMRYIKHSLVECRIFYIDDMGIDNTEQVCEGYMLDLSKLNLTKADLKMYNLSSTNLREANLKYSTLRQAILSKAILSKANLEGADLEGADLSGVNLREANLKKTDLSKTNLIQADLSGANLEEADLSGAYLRQANLKGANLEKADLSGVNFEEANLEGIDLDEAIIDEFQVVFFEKKYDLYNVRVYLDKTREIISYSEYCRRKK